MKQKLTDAFPTCGAKDCKYHVATQCFARIPDLKAMVAPGYVSDYKALPDVLAPATEPVRFAILAASVADSIRQGVRPDYKTPTQFIKELRIYREGDAPHYGWVPYFQGGRRWESWSYQAIFKPDGTAFSDLETALRSEVAHDVREVQEAHPLYGEVDIDVHHDPTFRSLIRGWVSDLDLDVETIEYEKSGGLHVTLLRDRGLAESFILHHLESGSMTALTKQEHYEAEAAMRELLR